MQKFTNRFCTGRAMSKNMLFLAWFVAGTCPAVLAAQSYKSLNDKVQLQMENTTAAAVVKALQQQTKYTFIYDPEYLQHCKVSAPHFNSHSIADVLRYLDENEPIDIEMTNGSTIALRRGHQERVAAKDGKITGKIVDNKNEPLPGVTILVDGGRGVISQADGTYELNLPPGNYTITYSFISYETKRVTDVVVREDANTPLNVLLRNSSSRLKEVTVTASYRKASVEGLYAMQKNNAAMTDGISAEQISRTPDRNMGDVLKRVSGVSTVENKYVVVRGLGERYNQAVLNGQVMPSTELNRKNFSFNILPANIVENTVVVKTLTPDHSAEFGGGSVEVTTLDIPNSNFLNITAGTSYNDNTTGKKFISMKLTNNEYLGKVSDHRYLMGSLDWKSRDEALKAFDSKATGPGKGSELINNNWRLTTFNAQPSQNYQLSLGHLFKGKGHQFGLLLSAGYRNTLSNQDVKMSRNGFAGALADGTNGFKGQRFGFNTDLGAMAGIGYRNATTKLSFQALYLRSLDQALFLGYGPFSSVGDVVGYFDVTQQTSMLQNTLKGEHILGRHGIKLLWSGSYLRLDKQRPDNHQELASTIWPDSSKLETFNVNNGNSIPVSFGAMRTWSRALEKNASWEVNLSVPFKVNMGNTATTHTFKTGYNGWYKDRLFYVLNSGSNFNAGGFYVPIGNVFTPENNFTFAFDRQFGDNFHRDATLHAGYLMLDDQLGDKWRLVWGVRAEYYDLNRLNQSLDSAKGVLVANNGGKELDFSTVNNHEKNLRFFPSANLTYSLTPNMNLRLAYAQSIVRPDLRELAYFREYDFELGGTYEGGYVRSTTIQHFDFRYEWYPGPGEILSASIFLKNLDYPMEIYKKSDNAQYELKNNKLAQNYGFELEARKSFAFTGVPVVKNITLYGNFTRLYSTVTPFTKDYIDIDSLDKTKAVYVQATGPKQKRPQSGASNYLLNAGAYYDIRPLTVSLSYNFVSNRMFRVSEPYQQSLFERPLQSLDAQVAIFLLKHKMEIKLGVANLLNSYFTVYRNIYDDGDVTNGKKDPSAKDLLYQKNRDYIDYQARLGRTYSTSISYRF